MILVPELSEFKKLSKKHNLIPVYTEILADMETPVSAYKKLRSDFSFLLESVEGGEHVARYSFIGADPELLLRSDGKDAVIIGNKKEKKIECQKDSLEALKKIMSGFKPAKIKGLPPFHGGAVGYLSYDIVRRFEDLPDTTEDELNLPEVYLMLSDTIVIFDHVKHTMNIVTNVHTDKEGVEKGYKNVLKKIAQIRAKLKKPAKAEKINKNIKEVPELIAETTKKEYEEIVRKTKEYIKAGDIIQAVLSQRFKAEIKTDTFDIYRSLRIVNPSPYMYFLEFKGTKIIGASPELMVKVNNGIAETRPLAGTRKRGITEQEDMALEKELLADKKERAEHIMLIDLARNDLGRICDYKSVKVQELMKIEKYSHVMHIVSSVVGKLSKGRDAYDCIRACFPAGTLSGAPKIRAMEIIEELEKMKRGPYGGAVGYFSYSGDLDSCITIRTMVVKDKTVYIQAGAGLVADSDPETEYYETMNKAKATLFALRKASEEF